MHAPLPPLIHAMLQADFYPHATASIELQQTHASWVLLTGEYAYKVKKPVDFGFLDFSTLELREHFCREELHLNRRLAADIYLEVLPITRQGEAFRLGERGEVCEWCVKMRQFAAGDLLAERIAKPGFDAHWMDELAHDIADFHAHTGQGAAITAFGTPDYLWQHIRASLDTALAHPDAIEPSLIEGLRLHCTARIGQQAGLFAERMAGGHIRDCHGDLHLGNITLYRGRPTVFDCIEFNPEYRAIDTLNDAAFLVMDCEARGHTGLGMRFLSRYLEQTGDYAGMPLMPLFLSYRAGVRGKVACLLADDGSLEDTQRCAKLAEAKGYFELATRLLTPSPTPALYAIGGLSGSGKSHLALQGCGLSRSIIIRSDATRKRIAAGHPGLDLYGEAMNRHTYQAIYAAAGQLLDAGWSVILDATFLSKDERDRARKAAESSGTELHFIWLDVPGEKLREHIRHRQAKGKDISDADLAVLDRQLAAYQRPDEAGILFLSSAEAWPWSRPPN